MYYLFFDIDGVIINGYSFSKRNRVVWYETIQQDLGISYKQIQDFFLSNSFIEILKGNLELYGELSVYFANKNISLPVAEFVEYWFRKDSRINHQLLDRIASIQDCQKYLVTIQERNRAHYLWHELRLSKYFDGIFYSADLGYLKDDMRFYQRINEKLNIDFIKDTVVYYDDNPFFVETASKAGWNGILFDNHII